MAIQSQPSRISEPFAGSGTKNTIPATNSTPSASQAASWASGFPPECSQPISAGGCPVPRNDMNGVLNWLSQGFAFQQDGGIWEWSALADYDLQRVVRGSDGVLYCSVAQSGPGVVAGAQDPTADNGTYWGPVPVATPAVSAGANEAVTAAWVKSIAAAPVYLDPAGSDSNDGMSASTPVQTFAKAIQIASALSQQGMRFMVAAGTYVGNLELSNNNLVLETQGAVSISGYVEISNKASCIISGSGTLSISGYIYLYSQGFFLSERQLTINSTSSASIRIEDLSCCDLREDCLITTSNVSSCIFLSNNSFFISYKPVSVTATSVNYVFYATRLSMLRLYGNVTIGGTGNENAFLITSEAVAYSSGSVVVDAGCVDKAVISMNGGAFTFAGQSNVIHGATAANTSIILLAGHCYLDLTGSATLTIHIHGTGGRIFYMFNNSCAILAGGAKLAFVFESGATARYILDVWLCSTFSVLDNSEIDFGTGTVNNGTIDCTCNSLVEIATGATLSGTITGKRYVADFGGQIYTSGSGANRIPGSTAGTVSSTSYGYYN